MADIIEKNISALIQNQFPALYQAEGPVFVDFVEAYYKWMEETNNPIYHSRRLFEYRDIDETIDDFLIYFKEKYLKNIQFETTTDVRQIVKHSLDLYRSKGTERGVDLLFRLVFGIGASVYHPSTDLFRLSDGKWVRPTYLEVSLNDSTVTFVNKQIRGLTSGATAFAERVVRKTVKGQFIDVIYISAIHGDFVHGEIITDDVLNNSLCPTVVGSLTEIIVDVTGSGTGFDVGDILTVTSPRGNQALARVSNTTNTSGIVNFELLNGGYAYSNAAQVIVSENSLKISNLQMSSNNSRDYFDVFETITQPMANINYIASNGSFAVGDNIYTYYANGSLDGSGAILALTAVNSTAGEMFVHVTSGNLQSNAFYTTSNAVGANQTVSNGYFNRTATGNVMGISSNVTIGLSSVVGTFILEENVYQINVSSNVVTAYGKLQTRSDIVGAVETQFISESNGIFRVGQNVHGSSSNSYGTISNVTVTVGVFNVNNGFLTTGGQISGGNSISNGYVTVIGTGTGATFSINPTLLYPEFVVLSSELISTYLNVSLNATSYGMPNLSANLTNLTIDVALGATNTEIGKIYTLESVDVGQDYTYVPFVRIYEPKTAPYKRKDRNIYLVTATSGFSIGELVIQSSSNARGIIKEGSNNTVLMMENLRWDPSLDFVVTVNSTSVIVGEDTGTTANISLVGVDGTSDILGENAVIAASVVEGNGAVTRVSVVDSGFGYQQGETLTLFKTENGISFSGVANLINQGYTKGFFTSTGSFLSSEKKLFDGYYWQEYSYEVRAAKQLSKYENMLKQVMHVAGTIFFGAFEHKALIDNTVSAVGVTSTSITEDTGIPTYILSEDNFKVLREDGSFILGETSA